MKSLTKLKKIKGDASYREFYSNRENKSIIVISKKEKLKNLLIYDAINKILIKNKILAPILLSENYINNYIEIYDDDFLRISTLPYDLIGLINFIYTKEYKLGDVIKLLNNPNKKFDGIDGNFYFKDNMIERDLSILRINNGNSYVIN